MCETESCALIERCDQSNRIQERDKEATKRYTHTAENLNDAEHQELIAKSARAEHSRAMSMARREWTVRAVSSGGGQMERPRGRRRRAGRIGDAPGGRGDEDAVEAAVGELHNDRVSVRVISIAAVVIGVRAMVT